MAELKLSDFVGFDDWVRRMGGEVLAPTSEWEVIRFKGSPEERTRGMVHIAWRNKQGRITANAFITSLVRSYKSNMHVTLTTKLKRLGNYKKQKEALLHRDGDECFYCGLGLSEDITVEHLITLVGGGSNKLGNLVLAHELCNQEANDLSLIDKIKLREKKRILAR